ncbi:MAG: signal recognition particle-docking protein FtsY [Actinomycetota bacterium]
MPEILVIIAVVALVAGVFTVALRKRPAKPEETRPASSRPSVPAKPQETPVVEDERAPVQVEPEPVVERKTLKERLGRSRRFFADRLSDVFGGGIDDDVWEDLEAVLIQADVGVETATKITGRLRERARERKVTDAVELRGLLADELLELFDSERDRSLSFAPEGTTVWLIVGVNGTGKTTTIGKLAHDLRERGHSVAMAAADTFRAAADEQLGVWAERTGAQLVKHQPGADPGAVAFDAYRFASARSIDVLLVDTAGRLHTKTPLMDELSKVRRVIEKEGRVQEALLVLDATAGQNGLVQAREFSEAAGVSGVVLTKLDGSAKGGIVMAIEDTLGLPIKLIGVGEGIDDLEPFGPKAFVDALLT